MLSWGTYILANIDTKPHFSSLGEIPFESFFCLSYVFVFLLSVEKSLLNFYETYGFESVVLILATADVCCFTQLSIHL
jgi:hypothetical protein